MHCFIYIFFRFDDAFTLQIFYIDEERQTRLLISFCLIHKQICDNCVCWSNTVADENDDTREYFIWRSVSTTSL